MRRHHIPLALLLAVATAVCASVVPGAVAASKRGQACNLRGSWVANNAETNRYFQALNPTTGDLRVASGALSATFTRGTWTFGGIGLHLVGRRGSTTIKEEIDLDATAPYTVRGATIHLGNGHYKLIHVHTTLTTSGKTASVNLPNTNVATPPKDVPYRCTPRVLHLTVTAGLTNVTLTLRRGR